MADPPRDPFGPPPGDLPPDRPALEERVEGWIRTMLSDSMLGPLYAVLLGHGVAFFAPVLLLSVRDGSPFGLAALAILVVASGSVIVNDFQRYRRPGPLGGTVLAIWGLSAAAAWAADHYGIW